MANTQRWRSTASSSLAFAACVLGLPAAAHAVVLVEVIWSQSSGSGETGSGFIEAEDGDTLTALVRLHSDAREVSSYSISLEFDTVLDDELELLEVIEELPSGFAANETPGVDFIQESTDSQPGQLLTFEATGQTDWNETPFDIGVIRFKVTHVATDGYDLFLGAHCDRCEIVSRSEGVILQDVIFKPGGVNAPD